MSAQSLTRIHQRRVASSLLPALAPLALGCATAQATSSVEQLEALLKRQQSQMEHQESQMKQQQAQINALADQLENGGSSQARWSDRTTLGGYGEAYFKRIDGTTDELDAYRIVLFLGHEFNAKLRFGSEIEIEHGYVKDTDTNTADGGSTSPSAGYLAVEQLFLQYDYVDNHRINIGQLLVPVGIVNETHEPETFYGVFRPVIEREIIPSTWFEPGIMASGSAPYNIGYDLMLSSGLKNTSGKIKDGRQRGSKANASDLATTLRLKYTGISGAELGVTWHEQSDMTQGTGAVLGEDLDGRLLETHASLQRDGFGLRLLAARWTLNEDALLLTDQKRSEQAGWYAEPSYKITEQWGVFSRYSVWDNEKNDSADSRWKELALGFNYWLDPRAVIKADLQRRNDPNPANTDPDGFNLGIGFSF